MCRCHVEAGFFHASIEQALVAGEVDVAVHSYKDLLYINSGAGVAADRRGGVSVKTCCAPAMAAR